MLFYFKIQSKNNQVLNNFFFLLQKFNILIISLEATQKKKKRRLITILNSPHINKKAQEQFEFRFYRKHFLIRVTKPLTFLFFLKKLKNLSFCNIKFKIKKISNKNILKLLNPNNLNLKITYNSKNFTYHKTPSYIQLFDVFGELYLQTQLKT